MKDRRPVVYLVAGGLLCVAGVVLMLIGSVHTNTTVMRAGMIIYMASIPLIFQAKLTRMEIRLNRMEAYLREKHCREARERYYGSEEETDPPDEPPASP